MKHNTITLLNKAIEEKDLTMDEGVFLYRKADTAQLIYTANEMRKKKIPHGKVTWMIDRNVNITNVCMSRCKFCNFHTLPGSNKAYITTLEEYDRKIKELFDLGGEQLLLQGGMHPDLGLAFYTELFSTLKDRHPKLKLHALGPPEIVHLAQMEKKTYQEILEELVWIVCRGRGQKSYAMRSESRFLPQKRLLKNGWK